MRTADPIDRKDLLDSLEVDDPESSLFSQTLDGNIVPDVHPRVFQDAIYPQQFGNFDPSFVGEYRGSYGDRWHPSASTFGRTRNGGTTLHTGVDIFGLRGTPLVAVVDGELRHLPDDGGKIGNRSWLRFRFMGGDWRFIYGHLDSFEGGDRSVRKGDKIGTIGCSGNAASAGCGSVNACGLRNDHVHLALISPSGTFENPASALGWRLRYADDARNIECRDL